MFRLLFVFVSVHLIILVLVIYPNTCIETNTVFGCQLSNVSPILWPNFPTFQLSLFNFATLWGLTLECSQVGKSVPKSWRVGKSAQKMENWKVGMLESWTVEKSGSWNAGKFEE